MKKPTLVSGVGVDIFINPNNSFNNDLNRGDVGYIESAVGKAAKLPLPAGEGQGKGISNVALLIPGSI